MPVIGSILDYGGASAPDMWLLCYGQNVSRTTYADLFAAIGTTFGVGDGSTTFGIPDLRGRVVAGKDDMGGTSANRVTATYAGFDGDVLGAAGGDERMQSHTHTVPLFLNGNGTPGTLAQGGNDSTTQPSTGSTGAGSSQNVQPTLILNKIIYAGV